MSTSRRNTAAYNAVNTTATSTDLIPPSRNSPEWGRMNANILSWISWSWVSDIIKIGKQRALTLSDIDEIDPNHSSKTLLPQFLCAWNDELQQHPNNPSLIRALHHTISPWKFWIPIISTIPGYFIMILIAIFLRYILLYIEGDESITNISAYYYCAGLSVCSLWLSFHGNWLWFASISNGIDIRVALTSAIIEKSLKISSNSIDSSHIINLLSIDVQRFEETLRMIVPTLFPPIFIILTFIYFSYILSNWYCMMGLLLFVILIPIQLCFGLRFGKFKDDAIFYTDKRLKIINEVIMGALVTKMYCWENSLLSLVEKSRKKEIKYIKRSAMLRSINKAIYASSQCLLIMMIFLPYYYTNGILDVSMIYPILAVYTSLKIPLLWFVPYCVQLFSELSVSTRRISQFLQTKELKEMNNIIGRVTVIEDSMTKEQSPTPYSLYNNQQLQHQKGRTTTTTDSVPLCDIAGITNKTKDKYNNNDGDDNEKKDDGIYIINGNFSWDKIDRIELTQKLTSKESSVGSTSCNNWMAMKYSLENININIKWNELIAVIGDVGSGKTNLLSAILAELPSIDDYNKSFIYIDGNYKDNDIVIGYASQKAWILNDSIRNNILFGNEYNEEWYNLVIDSCALRYDLNELPYFDETIIGERGVNLSGGQKSRINIARAIYCKPNILLIDDCLSAVDSIVAKWIFDNILSNDKGLMKDTIRLLVTHQIQFISKVNSIIIMKDGKLLHHDTFNNIERKVNIEQIIADHSSDDYSKISPNNDDGFESFDTIDTSSLSRSPSNSIHCTNSDISPLTLSYIDQCEHVILNITPTSNDDKKNQIDLENLSPISFDKHSDKYSLKEIARRHSIVQEEEYETGGISLETYSSIIYSSNKSMKIFKIIIIIILMIGAQICLVASEYWLGIWASHSSTEQQTNSVFEYIYYLLTICTVLLALWRTLFVFNELLKSCERLSNDMFYGVLYSPMTFFESNPVGRILNRFSKDQMLIDDKLPLATYDWIESITTCFIVFILSGLANIYLYIVFIPIIALIIYYGKSFLSSSRVLKRLDAKTRSPIFALFSMIYSGLPIIRAFKKQQYILFASLDMIDINTRVYMIYHSCVHWLGFRLDLCIFIITSTTAFMCVYVQDMQYADISPAAVGVTLSYMLLLSKILPWTVRQFATVENIMISVERIIEYGQLPPEEDEKDKKLYNDNLDLDLDQWPKNGNLRIENLSVSYRDYLHDVLHDINIEINDCEKIGICGRTGCGKTTLFISIFRLLNISSGSIYIDNIDINKISLYKLRSSISIIPQNPILFSETLRYNIDPFNEYTDNEIYNVLKDVQLFDMVINKLPNRLLTKINESGSNFSVGECQLICIGRALLNKKSKILLLDEATGNIDPKTDLIIQDILRKKFKNKTVLTIAHRLNTIIDNDRILVMDKGRIVEFDKPCNLILKPNGIFAKMYAETNNNKDNHIYN